VTKLVHAAFIAFWAGLGMLLLLQLTAPPDAAQDREPASASVDRSATAGGEPKFTRVDIAQHNRRDDCWMAIEGSVYDLTDYLPRHPAAPELLDAWCGTEATVGMRTKGNNSDHSARAWRMLERYRIGELIEAEAGD